MWIKGRCTRVHLKGNDFSSWKFPPLRTGPSPASQDQEDGVKMTSHLPNICCSQVLHSASHMASPRSQMQLREVTSLPKDTQQKNGRVRIPKMFVFSSLHNTTFPTGKQQQQRGRCCSLRGHFSHYWMRFLHTQSFLSSPITTFLPSEVPSFSVLYWVPAPPPQPPPPMIRVHQYHPTCFSFACSLKECF